MTNKKIGNAFEQETAELLRANGFWCKILPTGQGQPCDIVAARNNVAYFFECKHVEGKYFDRSRIEANQSTASKYIASCGNTHYYLVIGTKAFPIDGGAGVEISDLT